MEGLTPVQNMRETSKNLPKPFKKLSPRTQNQNPRENLTQNCLFFLQTSGVATPQPSGSNPDRSPTAQWLNMRISPASSLPAPGSDPSLCLQGSTPNPVPGPALAESPVRRGRFSEITILAEIPVYSKPLPGPALAASPVRQGRFSEITIWPRVGGRAAAVSYTHLTLPTKA